MNRLICKAKDRNGNWIEGLKTMMPKCVDYDDGSGIIQQIVNEWVVGIQIYISNNGANYRYKVVEVDPNTVCQYIGKDLKENNVYIGDIIRFEDCVEIDGVEIEQHTTYEVYFDENLLSVMLKEFYINTTIDNIIEKVYLDDHMLIADMCICGVIDGEVVGNIHDKECVE